MSDALTFQDLLAKVKLTPAEVALIFHTPVQDLMRRALPMLLETRSDLFDAYQSVHSPSVEATLQTRSHAASFADVGGGVHAFIGLYKIDGYSDKPLNEIDHDARFIALSTDFGDELASEVSRRKGIRTRRCFSLKEVDALSWARGKLLVRRPSGRRYVRLAETTELPVLALTDEPAWSAPPKDWRRMALTTAELRILPDSWAKRLSEWRGIYLIVDQKDGARYVGSAAGKDNILGRWREHVQQDAGITAELAKRNVATFRFTILERVSPDLDSKEVTKLEDSWKLRLDTIKHGLNRN